MNKLTLALLPTGIRKMERWSAEAGKNIFIKRDDQTGSEWSGNKIRKLEFVAKDALDKGCNLLITCGGIQSNHCRATVAVATYLGMKSAVLLRISETPQVEGNYFLDKLLGADVRFCNREEYSNHRAQIMQEMADGYARQGYRPYIIPEGASFGVGTQGYYYAMKEIAAQEEELGVTFDTVVVATGSGGTAAGLQLSNIINGYGKNVFGVCVCDDEAYFRKICLKCSKDCLPYLIKSGEISRDKAEKTAASLKEEDFSFIEGYVGRGYALSAPEELEHIKRLAQMEATVFDPVYTGKATFGMVNEMKRGGRLESARNILFIHTGGLYGLFPVSREFVF
ncbi:MAG: D-cysteine desulfhydrase family protein [Bacteroidales bacterium]|nr:D-cysteine desulfhydrase family protein [Candidatus Cacconaster merdequi]